MILPKLRICYKNFPIVDPNFSSFSLSQFNLLLLLIFNKILVIKQITKPVNMPNPPSKMGGSPPSFLYFQEA